MELKHDGLEELKHVGLVELKQGGLLVLIYDGGRQALEQMNLKQL